MSCEHCTSTLIGASIHLEQSRAKCSAALDWVGWLVTSVVHRMVKQNIESTRADSCVLTPQPLPAAREQPIGEARKSEEGASAKPAMPAKAPFPTPKVCCLSTFCHTFCNWFAMLHVRCRSLNEVSFSCLLSRIRARPSGLSFRGQYSWSQRRCPWTSLSR